MSNFIYEFFADFFEGDKASKQDYIYMIRCSAVLIVLLSLAAVVEGL
jgi:hypothetical protein